MSDDLKTDLFLPRRAFGSQASNRMGVDLGEARGDLRQVSSRDNLAQAILNRLLTRRGELAGLGHPDYGSRLFMLIGEPNNERARARAQLYVRESLAAEARIEEIVAITFEPPPRQGLKREVLEMRIVIKPVGDDHPLTLLVSANLGG